MTELDIAANELSGTIPPELGNPGKLKVLYLKASQTLTEVTISINNRRGQTIRPIRPRKN